MTADKLYELSAYVEQQQNINNILRKAEVEGYLEDNEFISLMEDWLISPTGYLLDTGCGRQVRAELALRLSKRIKKHPILWKIFIVA